jgi:CheY-like chemotaxis protein
MQLHVCGHCENHDDPVTVVNGLSFVYNDSNVQFEVHLHHQCAAKWSELFNIPLPTLSTTLPKNNPTRNVRILVADDNAAIMRVVKRILQARPGFEVVGEACDGRHAVTQAQALKPDVIIINVTMPRMSGFEAATRIRCCLPDCAIVILSSHKDQQFIAEARKAGANGYVAKSDADRELVQAVESAVKGEEFFLVD